MPFSPRKYFHSTRNQILAYVRNFVMIIRTKKNESY